MTGPVPAYPSGVSPGTIASLLPHGCRCETRWNGLSTAHCGSCHFTFSSVSAFDQHRRTGRNTPRACQDPVSSGLVERERAGYTVWGFPAPEDGEGFRGYPD